MFGAKPKEGSAVLCRCVDKLRVHQISITMFGSWTPAEKQTDVILSCLTCKAFKRNFPLHSVNQVKG